MAQRQIFHDPTGRRRRRFRLAVALFVLLNLLAVAALFATIRVVPAEAPLPVATEHGLPRATPKPTLLGRAQRRVNAAIRSLLGVAPPTTRQVGPRRATAAAAAMARPEPDRRTRIPGHDTRRRPR